MKHRIKPFCHGADQGDQRFRIGGIQLIPSGDAPQRVVATTLPELNTIGEPVLKSQLMTGPQHGLAPVEVEGFRGEEQKIELFNASSAEANTTLGRSFGHGCDDARG